ncbi:hypothetical protein D9M68_987130 [compost metagenome]
MLARGEGLRLAVVQRVGPGAGVAIEGEGAVLADQARWRHGGKVRIAGIDIVDCQRAAGGGVAGNGISCPAGFGH